MNDIPFYLPVVFIATLLLTVFWFYRVCRSKRFLLACLAWAILQSLIAAGGFYQVTDVLPPRIMILGILPTLIGIILMFISTQGKAFIDQIDLRQLTLFHSIRIPVEVVLFLLYGSGVMSVYITFEGTNFDILSGLTAPLIFYFAFRNRSISKKTLFFWNVPCLLLLLNVVVTAIFSFPSPLQKLAFDQPNIAVLYFPYVLLPTLIVPLVLFAHLIAFRHLRLLK